MKKMKKYGILTLLILVIAGLMAWNRELFSAATPKDFLGILSDCFLVPGVLFAGMGALSWASTKGVYDILSFGTGSVFRFFIPGMDREKYDNFYNYKMAKEEKGRKWSPSLLISGVGSLLLAILFFVIYNLL